MRYVDSSYDFNKDVVVRLRRRISACQLSAVTNLAADEKITHLFSIFLDQYYGVCTLLLCIGIWKEQFQRIHIPQFIQMIEVQVPGPVGNRILPKRPVVP